MAEKLEGLTFDQMKLASKKFEEDGYQETITIENIPVGTTECTVVLIKTRVNNKTVQTPDFCVIPFIRKNNKGEEMKLKFEGVKLNVLHLGSGKSYNGIIAKVTEDLERVITKPDNYSKRMTFESTPYVDSQGRARTILKYESIEK